MKLNPRNDWTAGYLCQCGHGTLAPVETLPEHCPVCGIEFEDEEEEL